MWILVWIHLRHCRCIDSSACLYSFDSVLDHLLQIRLQSRRQKQTLQFPPYSDDCRLHHIIRILWVSQVIFFVLQNHIDTRYSTAVLLYRICRCCSHLIVKLCHTFFHACSIPCIVIGFLAVWESKNESNTPHFYSLHSWLGFITFGLFVFQFVLGFFR